MLRADARSVANVLLLTEAPDAMRESIRCLLPDQRVAVRKALSAVFNEELATHPGMAIVQDQRRTRAAIAIGIFLDEEKLARWRGEGEKERKLAS